MSRLGWIVLALVGGLVAAALLWRGAGDMLGDAEAPRLVYLAILGSVVAAGILGSGMRLGYVARSLALWVVIVAALVAGYQYRYELQDIASRMTAGLIPGSPVSFVGGDGATSVMLEKTFGSHFEVRMVIDGAPVRAIVDTGASATVLTERDARAAGIDPSALSFSIPVSTANGMAMAAQARTGEIAVGAIMRRNLPVLVASPGALQQSLLGMNFLNTLSGYQVRGDRMVLFD
ncbi:MAG: TIGR02281 family clan AA aspartic protease [Rhizobiaceae bacterium]